MSSDRLTRKSFLRMSLGVVAVTVVGCDSDSGEGTDSAASGSSGGPDPSTTGGPGTTGQLPTDDTSSSSPASGETSSGATTTGGTTGGSDGGSSGSDSGSTGSVGSSSTGRAAADCSRNGAAGVQFDLHDHDLEISAEMLQPGTPLEGLTILGSGHPHTLDLSAEQVDALLAGGPVVATTSVGSGHAHQVTIECL